MTELQGIVKRIEQNTAFGEVFVMDLINSPHASDFWSSWPFRNCHRQPKIGDKLILIHFDNDNFVGRFHPDNDDRTLDWTKVGF